MGHMSQLLSLAISFKIIEILLSQKNWFRKKFTCYQYLINIKHV